MRLKRLSLLVLLVIFLQPFLAGAVTFGHSVSENPPPQIQPSLVITQFSNTLEFIEIYNQSSETVSLRDVQLEVLSRDVSNVQNVQSSRVPLPDAWLLSKQYMLLHRDAEAVSSNTIPLFVQHNVQNNQMHTIRFSAPTFSYMIDGIDGLLSSWMQHKQRGNASLKISVNALGDYSAKTTAPISYADALYSPAPIPQGLKIIEILPNANSCAPNDMAITCGDYIKLYNASSHAIDLQGYRLRTDSGGIKSSASNTFTLSDSLGAGETQLVALRDSGESISITNTGGYVWIEDVYGVVKYEETIVLYPDATVAAGKGMSWAVEVDTGVWQWMVPRPYDMNFWSVPEVVELTTSGQSAECPAGKERNPETNRCRNIAISTTAQAPCKAGQERNSSTGRCRNTASATTSQKPCGAGQYRNLETGRCRKLQSASVPAPCKANQERNPLTGRCKKIVKKSGDLANIEDVASAQKSDKRMLLYVGFGLVAAGGYGVYEWRQEIGQRLSLLRRGRRK